MANKRSECIVKWTWYKKKKYMRRLKDMAEGR